ncbi:MAG: nonstructural protein [Microvirus sp.]|nr:MAG: nonstructural protein [Microvirus sp.]
MSRITVCAVFDKAVEVFGRPFFVPASGQAMRSFIDEVNTASDSVMYKHPGDFDLYFIASYNEHDGTFEPARELLLKGSDVESLRK